MLRSSFVFPSSSPKLYFILRNPSPLQPSLSFKISAQSADAAFTPGGAKKPLKSLLSLAPRSFTLDSPISWIARVKNKALKKVISGQIDEAECLLTSLCIEEDEQRPSEEVYEAGLARVELLIHMEKYEDALKWLNEDSWFPESDGRPRLYKAIVHTMLGHGDAKNLWNSFIGTIGTGLPN